VWEQSESSAAGGQCHIPGTEQAIREEIKTAIEKSTLVDSSEMRESFKNKTKTRNSHICFPFNYPRVQFEWLESGMGT